MAHIFDQGKGLKKFTLSQEGVSVVGLSAPVIMFHSSSDQTQLSPPAKI